MHIVCTHEQADFDALASQLGVYLLDEQAIPVLPRRLNRNVRAYVTLHSELLPFIEFQDLPQGKIEQVTLVDTQSLPSVKGTSSTTSIHVIDHHPLDQAAQMATTFMVEEVGATTTLLAEELRASGYELEPTHATLLLLGVYEDTGSLSYASTTPRDVRAAAWLLEQGASLSLAADFLNHPLSNGQRMLYDRLLGGIETLDLHGLSIMLACAATDDAVEEISTLAHKLRDVFDPDGLFVLVEANDTIQLVARSTTGVLNVGQIAEAFGGGGHARAAAALLRGLSLPEARERLMQLLASSIAPAVTVGEIMSRDPQLLPASETIQEASERMLKFGHEGYPVMREGEIVGLLTRRAVDRAMLHGMGDQPVERIMEAGRVSVELNDSIHALQRVMIKHGWGQVPVIDQASGKVVGIVTRTDLLSALGSARDGLGEDRLADRLEHSLPPERLKLLNLVSEQAELRGDALYIVGGFVRDLLLGQGSVDFDLVVEGDAIGLGQALKDSFGGRVISHRRFGTSKWELDLGDSRLVAAVCQPDGDATQLPKALDFVTARTEFYSHPTALPSVQRGSIKLDLHRRDFTVNTLALRLDGAHYGQVLDPWGGGRDLRDGILRVLHSLSFVDDPTRMLRAVRLEQRLAFEIEPRTLELLKEAVPLLARVSGERIRAELDLIFDEPKRVEILGRLHEIGLMQAIEPNLVWDDWLQARFERIPDLSSQPIAEWVPAISDPFLYFAIWVFRLSQSQLRAVSKRLRFSASDREHLLAANRIGAYLGELSQDALPSALVAFFDGCSERSLVAAWAALQDCKHCRVWIQSYLEQWRGIWPVSSGETLQEAGLPPGPVYKDILWALRAGWLDGQITTEAAEKEQLQRLIKERRGGE